MLPADEARSLARIVLAGLADGTDDGSASIATAGMTALERAALEEIGNVAVSAVLSRLGDHLGEGIHPTVPVFVYDTAGAVLDAIVRLQFKAAGGAAMFLRVSGSLEVGRRNVFALHQALGAAGLRLTALDLGGAIGRSIELDLKTGQLSIRTIHGTSIL